MAVLKGSKEHSYIQDTINELESEDGVSCLFSTEYPQVLHHGDLSGTNILVDEQTFDITGFIDWSLAAMKPFGLEIWALRRAGGNMTADGWSDFSCRNVAELAFWDEFFKIANIKDPDRRTAVRRQAELAGKLGLILRFAFNKTIGGEVLDTLASKPSRFLSEFLKNQNWSQIVLRPDDEKALAELKEKPLGTTMQVSLEPTTASPDHVASE